MKNIIYLKTQRCKGCGIAAPAGWSCRCAAESHWNGSPGPVPNLPRSPYGSGQTAPPAFAASRSASPAPGPAPTGCPAAESRSVRRPHNTVPPTPERAAARRPPPPARCRAGPESARWRRPAFLFQWASPDNRWPGPYNRLWRNPG